MKQRFGFDDDEHLNEGRLAEGQSQFLGLLRDMHGSRKGTLAHTILTISQPMKRRLVHPSCAPPLRIRRDYTSVGRPTFLVEQLPEGWEDTVAKPSTFSDVAPDRDP